MFDEMGVAGLVIALHQRARVDMDADRQAVCRIFVLPHRIAHAVGQHAYSHAWSTGRSLPSNSHGKGADCATSGWVLFAAGAAANNRLDQGKHGDGGKEASGDRLHSEIPKSLPTVAVARHYSDGFLGALTGEAHEFG